MRTDAPPTLETAECDKVLDTLLNCKSTHSKERKAIRNHCMALLMLEAGLRVGEVVSLRFSDLFFNKSPVTSIRIKPHMTKNKVEHNIPVSPRLAESLSAFATSENAYEWMNPGQDWFAFKTEKGKITTRQIERIIRASGWKALGRPIHPHILRHTFASRLIRITNTSMVQLLLGHKYLSSTQVYIHHNEEDKRDAIVRASAQSANPQMPVRPELPESVPASPAQPSPLSAFPGKHLPSTQW